MGLSKRTINWLLTVSAENFTGPSQSNTMRPKPSCSAARGDVWATTEEAAPRIRVTSRKRTMGKPTVRRRESLTPTGAFTGRPVVACSAAFMEG